MSDILTCQADGQPVIYTEEQRERDKGREPYPGCFEAYKDDPECDSSHHRHHLSASEQALGADLAPGGPGYDPQFDGGYDRSVIPYPVADEDWVACNPDFPVPDRAEQDLLF